MTRRVIDKFLTWVPLVLWAIAYILLKSRSLHWYLSDENIYYYLARDLSISSITYRDFFYANPPLLLPILKIGGVLTGWSVHGLRAIPVGASLLSGFLLYRTLQPRLGNWGVLPLWIFWFTYLALRSSTHATGINVVLAFVFLAYFFSERDKTVASGIALGLGLWVKTYAVVGIPGLLVSVWFRARAERPKRIAIFMGTVATMVGLLALVGTLAGGASFWTMNVGYHLNKPVGTNSFTDTFESVVNDNLGTLVAIVLAIAFALSRSLPPLLRKPGGESLPGADFFERHSWALMGAAHCATVLVFLALQKRVFDFYFLLLLPGLCIGLGGVVGEAKRRDPDARKFVSLLVICALLLSLALFPNKWRPVLKGPVSYWDHEARHVDRLEELSIVVTGGGSGALCGDSGTAPLLALLAGRELALGEADTNAMRFRSGYPTASEFIRELEDARVEWLLVRMGYAGGNRWKPVGMFAIREFWDYANRSFEKEMTIDLNKKDVVVLFRRRKS